MITLNKVKWYLSFLFVVCLLSTPLIGQRLTDFSIPYGTNEKVGNYVDINGIKIYYETYGQGKPMVLIHGNGDNIKTMRYQIQYFSKYYKIIVADSRGHGKSDIGEGRLTYKQMADDWASLLDYLKIDSVFIIGWSDGGIIGLLLAIHHPAKVKMLAAMGANLQPDTSAVYYWAVNWVKQKMKMADSMIARNDTTQNWRLKKQLLGLLGKQPNISLTDLHKISAPVLLLAGDKDVIREEHTVLMYQNIKKVHLCIFPGETHMIPITDPKLFNQTVHNFFKTPFKRPDTKDLFK